jgi:hypothetical protein
MRPQQKNGDGQSFEKWRSSVEDAIRLLGVEAYLDEGLIELFHKDHGPTVAAREWLRKRLKAEAHST